jgi:hypothetical protein
MLSAFFRLIARNFWAVTALCLAGTAAAAYLGDYQAMALLGSCFGGMLMWEAERHHMPAPVAVAQGAAAE